MFGNVNCCFWIFQVPIFGLIASPYPNARCLGYPSLGFPATTCLYKVACVQAGNQFSAPNVPYQPFGDPGPGKYANTLELCLTTKHPEYERAAFKFVPSGTGPGPDFAPLYNLVTPLDTTNPTRVVYSNVAVTQWIPNTNAATGGRNDINPQYGSNALGAPIGVVIYDPCTGNVLTAPPGQYVDLRPIALEKLPLPDVLGVWTARSPANWALQVPDHNINNPATATHRPKWSLGF